MLELDKFFFFHRLKKGIKMEEWANDTLHIFFEHHSTRSGSKKGYSMTCTIDSKRNISDEKEQCFSNEIIMLFATVLCLHPTLKAVEVPEKEKRKVVLSYEFAQESYCKHFPTLLLKYIKEFVKKCDAADPKKCWMKGGKFDEQCTAKTGIFSDPSSCPESQKKYTFEVRFKKQLFETYSANFETLKDKHMFMYSVLYSDGSKGYIFPPAVIAVKQEMEKEHITFERVFLLQKSMEIHTKQHQSRHKLETLWHKFDADQKEGDKRCELVGFVTNLLCCSKMLMHEYKFLDNDETKFLYYIDAHGTELEVDDLTHKIIQPDIQVLRSALTGGSRIEKEPFHERLLKIRDTLVKFEKNLVFSKMTGQSLAGQQNIPVHPTSELTVDGADAAVDKPISPRVQAAREKRAVMWEIAKETQEEAQLARLNANLKEEARKAIKARKNAEEQAKIAQAALEKAQEKVANLEKALEEQAAQVNGKPAQGAQGAEEVDQEEENKPD